MFDLFRFLFKSMKRRRFTLAAMAMSFRFFFAVFPALILIFTLLPYIPVDNLQAEVSGFLDSVMPADSLDFMHRVLDEFFRRPSAGVIYLNLGLLLFSSLGGIKVMMQAFSVESDLFRERKFLRFNAVALLIFVLLFLLFLVMIGLLVSGEYFINYLLDHGMIQGGFQSVMLRVFHWLIVLLAVQVAMSVLYYLGPATRERWKFFSPGSVVGGILIVLAVLMFRFFFVHFADYNKIYGSLGAIMLLMVWFYWLSIVVLVGFELNAAIAAVRKRSEKRRRSTIAPPAMTDIDLPETEGAQSRNRPL